MRHPSAGRALGAALTALLAGCASAPPRPPSAPPPPPSAASPANDAASAPPAGTAMVVVTIFALPWAFNLLIDYARDLFQSITIGP